MLVHEWSHMRWGVFDEYGGEYGTITPPFYIGEDYQVRTGTTTVSLYVNNNKSKYVMVYCPYYNHSGLSSGHLEWPIKSVCVKASV